MFFEGIWIKKYLKNIWTWKKHEMLGFKPELLKSRHNFSKWNNFCMLYKSRGSIKPQKISFKKPSTTSQNSSTNYIIDNPNKNS
jgi:hypothetical protein